MLIPPPLLTQYQKYLVGIFLRKSVQSHNSIVKLWDNIFKWVLAGWLNIQNMYPGWAHTSHIRMPLFYWSHLVVLFSVKFQPGRMGRGGAAGRERYLFCIPLISGLAWCWGRGCIVAPQQESFSPRILLSNIFHESLDLHNLGKHRWTELNSCDG